MSQLEVAAQTLPMLRIEMDQARVRFKNAGAAYGLQGLVSRKCR